VRIDELSFRHGKEILAQHPENFASILAAIINAQEAHVRKPRNSLACHLRGEFLSEGWAKGKKTEPHFSFLKNRVAIEIQLSSYELFFRSFLRFLSAYKNDEINVGVLITCAKPIPCDTEPKSTTPTIERVKNDLLSLRQTMTVPIWIIALK
jgi:hypothetical protein